MGIIDQNLKRLGMLYLVQRKKQIKKREEKISKIVKNIKSRLRRKAKLNFKYLKRIYYRRYDISWIEDIPNFIKLLHFMAYMSPESVSESFEISYNVKIPTQLIERYMKKFPQKIKRMKAICDLKEYDDKKFGLIQNSYIDKLKYKNLIRFYMLIYDYNYHSYVNALGILSGRIFGIPKNTQIYYKKRLIENILK